jgi:hypothetical protein
MLEMKTEKNLFVEFIYFRPREDGHNEEDDQTKGREPISHISQRVKQKAELK